MADVIGSAGSLCKRGHFLRQAMQKRIERARTLVGALVHYSSSPGFVGCWGAHIKSGLAREGRGGANVSRNCCFGWSLPGPVFWFRPRFFDGCLGPWSGFVWTRRTWLAEALIYQRQKLVAADDRRPGPERRRNVSWPRIYSMRVSLLPVG